MRHTILTAFVLLALSLCAGCAKDQADKSEPTPPSKPAPPPPPPKPSKPVSMTGVDWVLTRIGSEAARPEEVKGRPRFYLDPSSERLVTGHTGVNAMTGTYEQSGGALQFGPLKTTRRAASPELMQQEAAFLGALKKAATAQLTDRGLVLRDAAGATLAEFEAIYLTP